MKLFFSKNSPYARKCRVVMFEKQLEDRIELIHLNPLEDPQEPLWAVNPLGTVPALVTDTGLHLCDSTAICEYLDSLAPDNRLYPDTNRECVMAVAAMADGMINAAVTCVLEGRRPEPNRYPAWVTRKEAAISRTIKKFAAVSWEGSPLSIGTISLAVGLAYVSFRLPHLPWRTEHPRLAGWLDAFSSRPSMTATKPAA